MCLWDNDYLFVGCKNKTIKLIGIKEGLIIKSLAGHDNDVITLKKIFHPKFGDCLVSQGEMDDQIRIWIKKDNNLIN